MEASHLATFIRRVPNRETQAAMRAAENGEVVRFDSSADFLADLNDGEEEEADRG